MPRCGSRRRARFSGGALAGSAGRVPMRREHGVAEQRPVDRAASCALDQVRAAGDVAARRSGRCRRSSGMRRRARPRTGTAPGRPAGRSGLNGSWITSLPVGMTVWVRHCASSSRPLIELGRWSSTRARRVLDRRREITSADHRVPAGRRAGRLREPRERGVDRRSELRDRPAGSLGRTPASARTRPAASRRRRACCAAASAAPRSLCPSCCCRAASAAMVVSNDVTRP